MRRSGPSLLLALAVLGVAGAASCRDVAAHLVVRVQSSLVGVDRVRLRLAYDGSTAEVSAPESVNESITLPSRIVLALPTDTHGDVGVAVFGFDASGAPLGSGSTTVAVDGAGEYDAIVTLGDVVVGDDLGTGQPDLAGVDLTGADLAASCSLLPGPNLVSGNDATLDSGTGNWSGKLSAPVPALAPCRGAGGLRMCSHGGLTFDEVSLSGTPITVGTRYRVRAWVRLENPTQLSAAVSLRYDDAGGGQVLDVTSPFSAAVAEWQPLETDLVAPANAVTAAIRVLYSWSGSGCLELDQVSLVEVQ